MANAELDVRASAAAAAPHAGGSVQCSATHGAAASLPLRFVEPAP